MKILSVTFLACIVSVYSFSQQWLPVKIKEEPVSQRAVVSVDGAAFTSYTWLQSLKKPVLWPVIAPGGQTITRAYPLAIKPGERADHPHHVGIWLNFGDVNGLDFWNNSEAIPPGKAMNYGTIVHQSVDEILNLADHASLSVSALWNDYHGNTLLQERTVFEFRATPDMRVIDRITTLTAVREDVKFTDNKEGMFAIRVTTGLELPSPGAMEMTDAHGQVTRVEKPDLSRVTGDYTSSEGISGSAVWGTRGKWMRLYGTIDSKEVSVIILDHPLNPGYPTYWHARGYGLFAANPLGQKPLSGGRDELNLLLKKNESVTVRYRLIVSSGTPAIETIHQWSDEWSKTE